MTPHALLASLRSRGLTVTAKPPPPGAYPSVLLVGPRAALTADDRDWIALYKIALLLLLEGCYPDEAFPARPFVPDPPRAAAKVNATAPAARRRKPARVGMFDGG
jgi:hypothetical protein